MQTSKLGFSRIGDTRILTPIRAKALDLWFMLRLWPDADDREFLRAIQQSAHSSPPVQFKSKNAPWPSSAVVLRAVAERDSRSRQYIARHRFAAAARVAADQFQMHRPFDLFAVYAHRVVDFLSSEEGMLLYGDQLPPIEILSFIGAALIDSEIMQYPEEATTIARLIMEEITKTYPDER